MNRYEQIAVVRKTWMAPPELGHSIPRPVRLSKSGIGIAAAGVILALGSIVAGALLARESTRQTADIERLEQQGQDTNARIERLWINNNNGKKYRIAYSFQADGRTYEKELKIPQRVWKTLSEGGTIPIRFLPSQPDLNHPRTLNKSAMKIWVAILLPAFMIVLALVFLVCIRRQMDLLADGRPAPGVVTKIRNVKHEHGSTTIVEYEFPMLSGGIGKGKTEGSAKGISTGSTVTILYDPNNPRRTARYPLCLVQVDRG